MLTPYLSFINSCFVSIYSSNSFFDSISPNDLPLRYTLYTAFGADIFTENPTVQISDIISIPI